MPKSFESFSALYPVYLRLPDRPTNPFYGMIGSWRMTWDYFVRRKLDNGAGQPR